MTNLPCSEFAQVHTLLVGLQLPGPSAGRPTGEWQPEDKSACGNLNRSLGAGGRVSKEWGQREMGHYKETQYTW